MKTCCGVLGNGNQQSIDGDYIKVTCDICKDTQGHTFALIYTCITHTSSYK